MELQITDIPETTLHKLFWSQVRKNPEKIALVDGDVRLTYRELDQLTDKLANQLSQYHIQENDAIAIFMNKCYEYIVACLAILKSGGCYLHLELAYPNNFLQQIFTDAKPKVIITKQMYKEGVCQHNIPVLSLDTDDWQTATRRAETNVMTTPRSIATIGYSSGTTGKPKGIIVSHQAFLYAYFHFWQEIWHIQDKGRFAYTTFMAWDALSPLVMGQTGYIVPDEISFDPLELMNFIVHHQINHTFLTPSLLSCIVQTVDKEIVERKLQCLKIVWLGGEVTTQPLVDQILHAVPHLYLINNYGPAECFVITQGQLRANDPATPSICSVGKVLEGMEVMILDEAGHPVEPGGVGELYATGPCLADGYLNNPALTQEKFIPFNGKIFYKTSDSAQFLKDDRLIILGRRDGIVKIRSYNVNLLAIEELLKEHPHVSDSVVMAYGDEGEDKYLVAYLIPTPAATWQINPQTLSCSQISSYLEEHLPFYMVPRIYVELDSFPIHPVSQKLDKSSLPRPTYQPDHQEPDDTNVTQEEQTILGLLKDVLPHNHIKKTDNFFDIGLHSLLAAQLVTRIKNSLGVSLSVVKIYEYCTAQDLATYIQHGRNGHAQIAWQQETILEDTIVSSPRQTHFSSASQAVFMTGATGFVGLFLLAEILRLSPTIKAYCLFRSANRLPLLIDKLKFYQLWDESFADRIIPLIGDLEEPYFGWSQSLFEQYAETVEAVFHAGAWVNMVYPYPMLKATNVDGTREVVRFAACNTNKPLHYISTLSIFPGGNVSQYAENNQIDSLIERLTIGYSQSKWVAEKLVWQAIERDIPAQIYRLGNIGPDTENLLANDKDSVMMFLDVCKQLKMAPQQDDWFFEYSPVNFVARAIVQIALGNHFNSPVYHISSPNLIKANQLFDKMREKNYIREIVSFEDWLYHLRKLTQQKTNPRYDILEQSLQIEEEFLLEQEVFDTSLFIKQLKQYGLTPPTINEDYLMHALYPLSPLLEQLEQI